MTPEERLDKLEGIVARLGERTDGLAQSVELLLGMQTATEKRVARLEESATRLNDAMAQIVNILVRHDERLDDLEGNRPQQ